MLEINLLIVQGERLSSAAGALATTREENHEWRWRVAICHLQDTRT